MNKLKENLEELSTTALNNYYNELMEYRIALATYYGRNKTRQVGDDPDYRKAVDLTDNIDLILRSRNPIPKPKAPWEQ